MSGTHYAAPSETRLEARASIDRNEQSWLASCLLPACVHTSDQLHYAKHSRQQRKLLAERAYQVAGRRSCWVELSLCVVKFHFTLAPTESFQASMHDIIISPFRSIAKFLIRLVGGLGHNGHVSFIFTDYRSFSLSRLTRGFRVLKLGEW